MADREYVRVYFEVVDDPKFAGLPLDCLGGWLRLLMMAEGSWPSSSYLPHKSVVPQRIVDLLARRGILDILDGGRFKVRGLDAERARRSKEQRNGGDVRAATAERDQHGRFVASTGGPSGGSSAGTSGGDQRDQLSLAKPSLAEQSLAKPSNGGAGPDLADAWWTLTGKYPADRLLSWLDEIANEFGHDAASRAMASEHRADPSTKTLVSRTRDRLRAEKRGAEKAAEVRERDRLRAFAAQRQLSKEDAAEARARVAEMMPKKFKDGRDAA